MPRFLREEDGQGLVEYALILGIIAVGVIIAMFFLRDQLGTIFGTIGNSLNNVNDTPCQGQQQAGNCP